MPIEKTAISASYTFLLFILISRLIIYIVILEDADFLTYLYATAESIGNIKEVLYFYRNQSDSASKILETEKYYCNIYEAIKHIYKKTSVLPNYEAIRPAVEYEMLQMYSYGINICLRAYLNHEDHDFISMMKNLADLKQKTIKDGYESNYVQAKIEPLDIDIMKLNNIDPLKLLNSLR